MPFASAGSAAPCAISYGIPDTDVLALAVQANRILITDDRDFGELVFRQLKPHTGVIYLRLGPDADLQLLRERLGYVLDHYSDQLDQFLVVTRRHVRIRPLHASG
jgi:predicted nuclease of predicted toxin-antitoxin system